MRKIQKHSFEAVSLLTVENGLLDITIIPAKNQPDWLVPTSLIISVERFDERIWTYLWRNQEVAVYHLIPKEHTPDKLVILEGNTEVHRLALQTSGELIQKSLAISDVKDIELPQSIKEHMMTHIPSLMNLEGGELDYIYQAVLIDDSVYIVPELDLISHRLVDLDS